MNFQVLIKNLNDSKNYLIGYSEYDDSTKVNNWKVSKTLTFPNEGLFYVFMKHKKTNEIKRIGANIFTNGEKLKLTTTTFNNNTILNVSSDQSNNLNDFEINELPNIIKGVIDIKINTLPIEIFKSKPPKVDNDFQPEFIGGTMIEYLDVNGKKLIDTDLISGLGNYRCYNYDEVKGEDRSYWTQITYFPTDYENTGYGEAGNIFEKHLNGQYVKDIMLDQEHGGWLEPSNYIPFIKAFYQKMQEFHPTTRLQMYGIYPPKYYTAWKVGDYHEVFPKYNPDKKNDIRRLNQQLVDNADWFNNKEIYFDIGAYMKVPLILNKEVYKKQNNEYVTDSNGNRIFIDNPVFIQQYRGSTYQFQSKCPSCEPDGELATYRNDVDEVYLSKWQSLLFYTKVINHLIAYSVASGGNEDISNIQNYSKFKFRSIVRMELEGSSWNGEGYPMDNVTSEIIFKIMYNLVKKVMLWNGYITPAGMKKDTQGTYYDLTNQGQPANVVFPNGTKDIHSGMVIQGMGIMYENKLLYRDYGFFSKNAKLLCFTHLDHIDSRHPAVIFGQSSYKDGKTWVNINISYTLLGLYETKEILIKSTKDSTVYKIIINGQNDVVTKQLSFNGNINPSEIYVEYQPIKGQGVIKPTGVLGKSIN